MIEQTVIEPDVKELKKHLSQGWLIKSVTDKMAVLERVKQPTPVPDMEAKDIVAAMSPFDEPDEDEILYYSCPHYDVLMAKKDEQRKQIELEKQKHG